MISKQNCRAVTSPKNKRMNLFFYPDDSEILETWNPNSSISEDRKIDSFVCFLGEVSAQQFCFEIYWPLVREGLKVGTYYEFVMIGELLYYNLNHVLRKLSTLCSHQFTVQNSTVVFVIHQIHFLSRICPLDLITFSGFVFRI